MVHERRGSPNTFSCTQTNPWLVFPQSPSLPPGTWAHTFVFQSACPFDPHKGRQCDTHRQRLFCPFERYENWVSEKVQWLVQDHSLCAERSLGSQGPRHFPSFPSLSSAWPKQGNFTGAWKQSQRAVTRVTETRWLWVINLSSRTNWAKQLQQMKASPSSSNFRAF